MIDRNSPVTTDELHAYVDGMLPADRLAAVEAWLATHPEDAADVAEWRAQADAIRARYGAVADEPAPDRFALDRLAQSGRGWRVIAAAAIVAALLGGLAGWLAHGASAASPSPASSAEKSSCWTGTRSAPSRPRPAAPRSGFRRPSGSRPACCRCTTAS